MKKTYINPEMEIVEVKSQALLTGSLQVFDEEITSGDMLAPDLGAGDLVNFDNDAFDIEL